MSLQPKVFGVPVVILGQTSNGTAYLDSTGEIQTVSPGTTGQLLVSNGASSPPSFQGSTAANTLIDLDGVWTVLDKSIGVTAIAATAKPGSPQYTYTIASGDIPNPSATIASFIQDYCVFFTIGGQYTGAGPGTINWRFTLNGTEIDVSDGSTPGVPASNYWWTTGGFLANKVNVGDVIGVELWGDTTNDFHYEYATIYIVPRVLGPRTGIHISATTAGLNISDRYFGLGPTGAAAGVTYNAVGLNASGYPVVYDTDQGGLYAGTLGSNNQAVTLPSIPFFNAPVSGDGNVLHDNNYVSGFYASAKTLDSFNVTDSYIRYYYAQSGVGPQGIQGVPGTTALTTLGDILYEDATPEPARLAGNITSTKKFLTQTGTGSVSAAPAWDTIAAGDVPTLNQNTTGSAASFTGSLSGDVTGTQGTTAIANTSGAGGHIISALTTNGGTLTNNTSGNAATATKLATARNINGVAFDGTAAITVTADANTLTGTTLASGVTGSSLTSTGTLTGGATGSGFTVDLGASTINGTLPTANGGSGWAYAFANSGGSDFTTTSTTLVDITGMSFTAVASTKYIVEGFLYVNSSSTAGIKFGFNSTGGSPTGFMQFIGMTSATAVGSIAVSTNNSAEGTAFVAVAADGVIHFWGVINSGTGSPTISMRGEKVTSGTLTVYKGSYLRYRVLGT